MSRHAVGYLVVSVVVLAVVAGSAGIGYAQQGEGRFSVQWKDAPVADVLGALQRQFGIQYALSSELGSRRVTLGLTEVTPDQALQRILSAANLTAVNENGVWQIREVAQAGAGGRTYRPTTTGGAMAQPAPSRPALPGVNVGGAAGLVMSRPGGGVSGGAMGLQLGAAGLGTSGLMAQGTQQTYSLEDMVFRIIPLRFVDPYIVTQVFGGGTVGGSQSGGGGYGGGGYGGGGYGGGGYGGGGYGGGGYGGGGYGGYGGYGGGGRGGGGRGGGGRGGGGYGGSRY